jgi:hypothetical protein
MPYEANREKRRISYCCAKQILKNQNATTQQIKSCIVSLPESGNKALALRLRLQRKLDGLEDSWKL